LANTSRGTPEYLSAEGTWYDEMLSTINDSDVNDEGQTTSDNYPVARDHNSRAMVAKATAIASWQHHTQ